MDEQTGRAGYITRIEAFVDLMRRRKRKRQMNAKKQNEIIERLNSIDEENSAIAKTLEQTLQANSEKIAKLNSLSNEMKNSTIDN